MKPRQIQREAVIESHACPTCHRRAGYPCQSPSARTVRTHDARVELALTDQRLRVQCSGTSPSGTRCQLPDLGWWHRRGHHAFPTPNTSRTWAVEDADRERWRGQVAEVEEPETSSGSGIRTLGLFAAASFLALTGSAVDVVPTLTADNPPGMV